jgi:hypothetical protein
VNHRRRAFLAMLCFVALLARRGGGAPGAGGAQAPSCLEKARADFERNGSAAARLRLAYCERSTGHLIDALRDAQAVAARVRAGRAPLAAAARRLVKEVEPLVPSVTVNAPDHPTNVVITLDGRPLAARSGEAVPVDPGRHTVVAEATANGVPLTFERSFQVAEGESVEVAVKLSPRRSPSEADESSEPAPEAIEPAEPLPCSEDRSQHDVRPCAPIPQTSSGWSLDTRARLETSGYWDTNAVAVLSPSVSGSVASPTAGWNIGGSYLVDVVSAASPDIVSAASPP